MTAGEPVVGVGKRHVTVYIEVEMSTVRAVGDEGVFVFGSRNCAGNDVTQVNFERMPLFIPTLELEDV